MPTKGYKLEQKDFSRVGHEFDAHIEHAKERGDQLKVREIKLARAKMTSLGLSPYGTQFVNERSGQNVVLGQFNRGNKNIKLASYEVMEGVAQATGYSTAAVYGMVVDHEKLHKEIDAKEGTAEVRAMLTRMFNANTVHDIEEGVVSGETSKGIDAYGKERAAVGTVAAKLKTSRKRFTDIFINGRADELWGIMAANEGECAQVEAA